MMLLSIKKVQPLALLPLRTGPHTGVVQAKLGEAAWTSLVRTGVRCHAVQQVDLVIRIILHAQCRIFLTWFHISGTWFTVQAWTMLPVHSLSPCWQEMLKPDSNDPLV